MLRVECATLVYKIGVVVKSLLWEPLQARIIDYPFKLGTNECILRESNFDSCENVIAECALLR